METALKQLSETIREAAKNRAPLCIRGGGSKDFYGGARRGESLSVAAYRGIIDYEPSELVLTARAGTPLAEIETALREKGQMLAFEPPHFSPGATLGGCIAAGLSGPRRAYAGAARDTVLGVRMLDGKGDDLHFGGQVMKNVAGFDVSRLLAGSLGTLGVMLELSLKVLPLPVAETTLCFEQTAADAIALMNEWAGKPLPLSATVNCTCDCRAHQRQSRPPRKRSAANASKQIPRNVTGRTSANNPPRFSIRNGHCGDCR